MKRVTCLILALLMLAGMLSTVGAAEGPDPAENSEPVQDSAPAPEPEVVTPPAPEAPAAPEPPAAPEVPQAPEVVETPAEPSNEPAAEDAPVVEDAPVGSDAPVVSAPTAEPATIDAPADQPAPMDLPEQIPEQSTPTPDHRSVKLHANGGYFTGDHAGYDNFLKALVGDILPNSPDDEEWPGWEHWYTPERPGYRFLGWFSPEDINGLDEAKAIQEGEEVPAEVTDLFAGWMRVLVLDAEPGSFTGEGQDNYSRTVDVPNGTMPNVSAYTPVFDYDHPDADKVKFVGWYTEKTKVETTSAGGYSTWTVEPQGSEFTEGMELNESITTLYAGYKVNEAAAPEASRKIVTYYYDWNGVNGMWGECLTSSRAYEESAQGHTLTAEDLLIYGLNWDGSNTDPAQVKTQDDLTEYWDRKPYNGYKFLGWATKPDASAPDVTVGHVVKNGESLYAVWSKVEPKEGEYADNQAFHASGDRNKGPGPLEFIQFSSLRVSAHGTKNAEATVSMITTPVKAVLSDVEWTVTYSVPNENYLFAPPTTMDPVTVKGGETRTVSYTNKNGESKDLFKLDATGDARTLKVVNLDGQDRAMTVTVSAATDYMEGEERITRVYSNTWTSVSFVHDWQLDPTKAEVPATCSTNGQKFYRCSQCDDEKMVYTPMLVHTWQYRTTDEPTCTEPGYKQDACKYCGITFAQYQQEMRGAARAPHKTEVIPPNGHDYVVTSEKVDVDKGAAVYNVSCSHGDSDTQLKSGDANGDGKINVVDVMAIYYFGLGEYNKDIDIHIGDVNTDGKINVVDVMRVYYYGLGEIDKLG